MDPPNSRWREFVGMVETEILSNGEGVMSEARTRVLDLLKKELAFLEQGGYQHSVRSPWRAAYIFEESPSCPNYSDRARPHFCEDCWLMEFVAPEQRSEQVPCRFVDLAPNGVTVDSLYRCGTLHQSEETLRHWLHERIREIESHIESAKGLRLA